MPFAQGLGIQLTDATAKEVRGQLEWRPDRCTMGGALHGGALLTLADSLGAICAFLNLPSGAGTATLSSSGNLFRAVRSGAVYGTARPIHVGRSTIVVQTDLWNDDGRSVATVTQTQICLMPAAGEPDGASSVG